MRAPILPMGDRALIVQLPENIGEQSPGRVHAIASWLATADFPGVREIVPATTSITLFYCPLSLVAAGVPVGNLSGWLSTRIADRLENFPPDVTLPPSRMVEIPVCYGGIYGPDLTAVATRTHLSPEEVILHHRAAEYEVSQLGFAPGFPYLKGLPEILSLPRLDIPRTAVPPGSVGIANAQSCIYPIVTPGGWNLIGRTPLKLFSPHLDPPVLLRVGDRVKFIEITAEEFETWEDVP